MTILKQAGEADRIETLMGDDLLTEQEIRGCAGCGRPSVASAMCFTPKGPMCRTCRDATFGAPTPAVKSNRCPARPSQDHDISMRGADGKFRCWFCVQTRQQIEAES